MVYGPTRLRNKRSRNDFGKARRADGPGGIDRGRRTSEGLKVSDFIERLMKSPLDDGPEAIEEFFRRRYGPEALYLPSGRLALYVAFREWLRPGDRLLMSPVNDDVVFFTVLAAGLVPVLGPIDPSTGNLDPSAIDESTWSRVKAVMTTNLYGTPDRMDVLEERSRTHGLLLIEDACHAFDSVSGGRRIGTFGTAAVYSLSKHLGIAGGVLMFSDSSRRASLARRAQAELRHRFLSAATASQVSELLRAMSHQSRAPWWLALARERLVAPSDRRAGHRMPYTDAAVLEAQRQGGGLDPFDRWVRMDNPAYRTRPLRSSIRTTVHRLRTFDENRRRRIAGARKLFELGFTPPSVLVPRDIALLRVPLFVKDREKAIAFLARHGLTTEYIYDPPLDLYAPGLTEPIPSPPSARIWSRDVLPVNPLRADHFLAILRKQPQRWQPSFEVS